MCDQNLQKGKWCLSRSKGYKVRNTIFFIFFIFFKPKLLTRVCCLLVYYFLAQWLFAGVGMLISYHIL